MVGKSPVSANWGEKRRRLGLKEDPAAQRGKGANLRLETFMISKN